MPAKNRTKQYIENGWYHIYNRGVEKRLIFLDDQDYAVLLSYLKEYLLPKDEIGLREKLAHPNTTSKEKYNILKSLRRNNFADEITLLAYCLMPNHFHFFVKQKSALSIDIFMQSLATRYTKYFNKKYKRVGFLCQDTYKAALIESEPQFIHLSKYIHKQALASTGRTLQGWQGQPCSYWEYIGKRQTAWIHPEDVLTYFSKTNPALSYEAFIHDSEDITPIKNLLLED